jgi:multimeric flavodoxin WrbA
MELLAIYGSPRAGGNSDLLLNSFVAGAESSGCQITRLYVRKLKIFPCIACGECEKGECLLKDDMQAVYPLLLQTDAVIVATPVYFYNVPAQLKALIDRCQLFWRRNKGKKLSLFKPGYLIAVGGTRGRHLFDGIILTIKYFFFTFSVKLKASWTYADIDASGVIKNHPNALKEVYGAGKKLCQKL